MPPKGASKERGTVATETSPLVSLQPIRLPVPPALSSVAGNGTNSSNNNMERKARPPILPSAKSMPMPVTLTPRSQYAKNVRLLMIVLVSIVTSTANNVYFKEMVDAFKSKDPFNPHDYEYFVNQFTVFLYLMLPLSIILRKRLVRGGAMWWQRQHVPWQTFAIMGLMDCLTCLACTLGGAYTGGGMQNLLDQTMLPITLFLSVTLLGGHFTVSQYIGATIIMVGATAALLPTFGGDSGGTSTALGIAIYASSNFPSSFSGIYKEYAIKTLEHVDLYYLAAGVSVMQALFGFALMPLMAIPAFGGTPLTEVPLQLYQGWQCFRGINSQPGDDCSRAPTAMLCFVVWSFLYDISMLLITKEGSAALMVVSSALALPVTNLAFACRAIAGESVDPFNSLDVLALLLVSLGFVVYSATDIFGSSSSAAAGPSSLHPTAAHPLSSCSSTRGGAPSRAQRMGLHLLPTSSHLLTVKFEDDILQGTPFSYYSCISDDMEQEVVAPQTAPEAFGKSGGSMMGRSIDPYGRIPHDGHQDDELATSI